MNLAAGFAAIDLLLVQELNSEELVVIQTCCTLDQTANQDKKSEETAQFEREY